MKYDIKLEREPRFLKATLFGTETLSENKSAIELALKECAAHGYDRILVDVRNLAAHPGIVEYFELAGHLSKMGFTRSIRRLAIVHGSDRNHSAPFLETACQNRGVNIRAFVDADAAIEWLTE